MSGNTMRTILALPVSIMFIIPGAALLLPFPESEQGTSRGAEDWLQFQYDISRTGASPSSPPLVNTTIWAFQTEGPVRSSPVVVGDVVYIGSEDGCLYALNRSTGALLWKARTGGPILSSPAVASGNIYIGSDDGGLHAFNLTTGTQLFNWSAGSPIRCPVLAFSDRIVFGAENGNVTSLDLTGGHLWTQNSEAPVRAAPASDGIRVFVASGSRLRAFLFTNGNSVWPVPFSIGHNLSGLCVGGGRVYVGTGNGSIYALNPSSAGPLWSLQLDGDVTATPAYANGSIFIGTGNGTLYRLNATTGGEEWKHQLDSPVTFPAALAGELVLLGTSQELRALLTNGSEAWSLPLLSNASSPVAISRSRAYIGTQDGRVVAVGQRPTAIITSTHPVATTQGSALVFNGTSPDCIPVAYEWRSNLDGLLSTKSDFQISTLSLGTHLISFKVQDENWTWSAPAQVVIEVLPSLEWPLFHKDTSHRGTGQEEAPLTNTVAWRTTVGGRVYSSPSIYGGAVFIGSRLAEGSPGRLTSLDLTTGAVKWSFNSSGMIDATPACADGMVFVADDAGNVIAFDADPSDGVDEGEVDVGAGRWDAIWSYRNNSLRSVQASPLVVAGKVVVASKWEPHVFCLDEWTGRPIWVYSVPGDPNVSEIWSSPAVEGGLVLVGSKNNHLYALDLSTGEEVWNFTAKGSIYSSPCIYNETVYFGSSDWKLYAISLRNGTKKWEYTTGDEITATPTIYNGKVFFGSFDNSFRALDAETGQFIWDYQTGGIIHSSAAAGGGMVFFASYDGKIYALNATNGKLVWSYDAGAQNLRSSPALVNDRLYIATETGEVIAFGKAPDLSVSAANINFSSSQPRVGEEVRVTAMVENIGTLDAEAEAMIFNGLPEEGTLLSSTHISVPAGRSVEISANWSVEPGYNIIVVNVTNTVPYEANRNNNQAYKPYTPPPQPGWTMFKCDPQRSSARPNLSTPNSNELDWYFDTHREAIASPVIAGSRIYMPAGNMLVALDLRTRAFVWQRDAGETITSSPAVSNLVVFGTEGGSVMALNERGGALAWSLRTGGPIYSSPLVYNDVVYIGSSDGHLYSISLPDGRLLWTTSLDGPVLSSPALDPFYERLVIGSGSEGGGSLSCLFLNGTIAWSAHLSAPVVSTPAIQSGIAFTGCDDGNVYAFEVVPDEIDEGVPDPENATYDTLWCTDLSGLVSGDDIRIRSSPATMGSHLYIGAGHNTLVALSTADGALLWSRNLGTPVPGRHMTSTPAVSEGRLFVGAEGLYAVNTRNGKVVWTCSTGEWVWSSPVISGDGTGALRTSVVVVTEGGRLLVFSTKSQIPPEARISSPLDGSGFRVGELIHFDGSDSFDLDGEAVSFIWDFGDGNTSTGPLVVHSYTSPGSYAVTLTVEDDQGLEGRATISLTIRPNSAPILRFPRVSPEIGDVETLFQLSVTYFDEDNDPATYVRLIAGDQMAKLYPVDPDDWNSSDGKDYYSETTFLSGIYYAFFEASDGVLVSTVPAIDNLTVTNRSIFRFSDPVLVEMLYAGRGEVRYNYSLIEHEPPPGMVKVFPQIGKFELSISGIERWWWANISINFSTFTLTGMNRSTLRIYRFDPLSVQWRIAENAGIDLERQLTYANVTEFSLFSVLGAPLPNTPPRAVLSKKEHTIMEGEVAVFNASGSYDPDGDQLTFMWDFGEFPERRLVQGDKIAEHRYSKPGRYYVTVIVSDGKVNDTATATVIVKQKGGEQTILLVVILTVLVVAIIFMLPRSKRPPAPSGPEEELEDEDEVPSRTKERSGRVDMKEEE
ncbi:MAG: PQQ-binding-like beta-propeller repeat protein [Thermoplasmata archaeon]